MYPLQISKNRRYLEDANGQPYLLHGDTAWSLFTAVNKADAEHYLKTRSAQGFNSIIVNLIEHKFNGPATTDGVLPFHDLRDLSTPVDAYFDHCEWVMAKAAAVGIQVFLTPIYLGYPHKADDEGWYHEALACGVEKCRAYGDYVGRRFGKYDNLIWLMGGDRNPGAALAHVNAVADGIKAQDGERHLFTAHTLEEHYPTLEYGGGGWLNLNSTYSYTIVHRRLLADYRLDPPLPFYLIESTYEGMHNASAVQIRRQAYWALLCGGCGHFFGNWPIWGFYPGWGAALTSPGAQDMIRLQQFFTARPWHTLVPDLAHEVVIAGLGEFRGLDYCAAALSEDGRTLIAYMPTARTVTVDLQRLQAAFFVAWWFNPRTGAATPAGHTDCMVTRFKEFTPPADGDWVLVLEDGAHN